MAVRSRGPEGRLAVLDPRKHAEHFVGQVGGEQRGIPRGVVDEGHLHEIPAAEVEARAINTGYASGTDRTEKTLSTHELDGIVSDALPWMR